MVQDNILGVDAKVGLLTLENVFAWRQGWSAIQNDMGVSLKVVQIMTSWNKIIFLVFVLFIWEISYTVSMIPFLIMLH